MSIKTLEWYRDQGIISNGMLLNLKACREVDKSILIVCKDTVVANEFINALVLATPCVRSLYIQNNDIPIPSLSDCDVIDLSFSAILKVDLKISIIANHCSIANPHSIILPTLSGDLMQYILHLEKSGYAVTTSVNDIEDVSTSSYSGIVLFIDYTDSDNYIVSNISEVVYEEGQTEPSLKALVVHSTSNTWKAENTSKTFIDDLLRGGQLLHSWE